MIFNFMIKNLRQVFRDRQLLIFIFLLPVSDLILDYFVFNNKNTFELPNLLIVGLFGLKLISNLYLYKVLFDLTENKNLKEKCNFQKFFLNCCEFSLFQIIIIILTIVAIWGTFILFDLDYNLDFKNSFKDKILVFTFLIIYLFFYLVSFIISMGNRENFHTANDVLILVKKIKIFSINLLFMILSIVVLLCLHYLLSIFSKYLLYLLNYPLIIFIIIALSSMINLWQYIAIQNYHENFIEI